MIDHSFKKLFSFIFPSQLLLRSICVSVQEGQPIQRSVCLLVQTSVCWSVCWTVCTFACEHFNCIQRSTCFWIMNKGYLLISPYIFFQVYLRISIRVSIPWLVQILLLVFAPIIISNDWFDKEYMIFKWSYRIDQHTSFLIRMDSHRDAWPTFAIFMSLYTYSRKIALGSFCSVCTNL